VSIKIENAEVVFNGKKEKRSICIENEIFCPTNGSIEYVVDADQLSLTAGLIDLQVNGFKGKKMLDGFEDSLEEFAQHGITAFLPTLPSSHIETYNEKQLKKLLASARKRRGAVPLGWHLEGPFINSSYARAHEESNILTYLDPDIWERILKKDIVSLVTFAPESPAADVLLDILQKEHISAAIGHSEANEEQMWHAHEKGVEFVTHLFNAMPPFDHRKATIVGKVLGGNLFKATIVADLVHVNAEALMTAYRCLRGNLALVSDATPLLGCSCRRGEFLDKPIERKGGACYIEGTDRLIGSVYFLDELMFQAKKVLEISFEEAIDLVTRVPASLIGMGHKKGLIADGFDADCVLWDQGSVVATFVAGTLVYASKAFEGRLRKKA
jgi:N-acetylglucosamine-6-phosphate deacetylase